MDYKKELHRERVVEKPTNIEQVSLLTEVKATKVVRESTAFYRGPYVRRTHFSYFQPNKDAFLDERKSNDTEQ